MSEKEKKEVGGICVFCSMAYPKIRKLVILVRPDPSVGWQMLTFPEGAELHVWDEELTQLDCLDSREIQELKATAAENRKALLERLWINHGPKVVAEIAVRSFIKPP